MSASAGRLRVAQVITKLDVGGAQRVALDLAAGLDPARFEAVLVAGPGRGTGGELWTEARAVGLHTVVAEQLVREVHPRRDLLAVRELSRLFRRLEVDLVHTHSSKAGIVGRAAARIGRVPAVVHSVHGWSFDDPAQAAARGAFRWVEAVAARGSDRLLVVSEAARAEGLARRIGRAEQYVVIHPGVEVGRFVPARRDRSGPVRTIGTVTRLSSPKDTATLVRAFARLAGRHPEVRLRIAGGGPEEPVLRSLVRAEGLTDRVELLGTVDDVPSLLGELDLFVLSSRSEGFPLVVIEALAAGLPVVASAVGGIPELVDERCGILVPPGAVEAMAGALERLLADPVERARLAGGALEVASGHTVAAMVGATEAVYDSLAAHVVRTR